MLKAKISRRSRNALFDAPACRTVKRRDEAGQCTPPAPECTGPKPLFELVDALLRCNKTALARAAAHKENDSMSFPLRAGALLLLGTLAIPAAPVLGAALAAADQNNGYSGKVLDKVLAVWAPPPALKGEFEVRVRISLDGQGKVLDCKPTKTSGMEALDGSACGAVRQISAFGTPPYGMPLEVHLAFWTGMPKGKAQPSTLSTEEAMRAEVMARARADGALGEQQAGSVEERARERAEAIAKAAGQSLPEVQAAPVAPPAPVKDAGARTAAGKARAGKAKSGVSDGSAATVPLKAPQEKSAPKGVAAGTKKSAPRHAASLALPLSEPAPTPSQAPKPSPTGLSEEEMRLRPSAPQPVAQGRSMQPSEKASSQYGGLKAQDKYDPRYRKYLSGVVWELRNAIFIPAETAPGTYYATVRLFLEPSGAIKKATLLQSSGDKLLDRFVLQGIRRANSVPPPPAGLGATLEITFTLARR